MRFVFRKSGLYSEDGKERLATLKNGWSGRKSVFTAGGDLALETAVCGQDYLLMLPDGTEVARGRPVYAEGEDPHVNGWPVHRMPRKDCAEIQSRGQTYFLSLESGHSFRLWSASRKLLVQFTRQGFRRRWHVEEDNDISPVLLCSLFAFCQYLEHENEFIAV